MISNIHDTPFVSVIIPVFHDEMALRLCLRALERQTYPKEHYEVVVVNNDPTNALDLETLSLICRVVEEAVVGSYAARNKGIAVSRGEILAFTDADCVPAEDWIERGVAQVQQHPDAGLVAGKVVLEFRNGEPQHAVEWLENLIAFPQEIYLKRLHFGVTANLFTTREVIKKVGLFNATLKSGGDEEWGQRVFAASYTLCYADDARVHHPAMDSTQQFVKKARRVAGGRADRIRRQGRTSILALAISILIEDFGILLLSMQNLITSPRVPRWTWKLRVLPLLVLWLRVRISERIRIHFGGVSNRA
jgi:glycosyltransferase involved in cell wall biosynthesis